MEQEKKYLKTIEEVSDALAAGKVVYDENGSSFKLDRNGFIVSESESFGPCVGAMVDLNTENYILEPKPLEVKLWHLYENGRGEKVFIGHVHENIEGEIEFYGLNKYTGFQVYKISGKNPYCHYPDFDLVKELADLSKYFEKGTDNEKND